MSLQVHFKPAFVRQMNTLPKELQEEAFEKIELFKDRKNHGVLRVHKLHGRLAGMYSFSINFRFRIVFAYVSKTETVLAAIGDHTVYQ